MANCPANKCTVPSSLISVVAPKITASQQPSSYVCETRHGGVYPRVFSLKEVRWIGPHRPLLLPIVLTACRVRLQLPNTRVTLFDDAFHPSVNPNGGFVPTPNVTHAGSLGGIYSAL